MLTLAEFTFLPMKAHKRPVGGVPKLTPEQEQEIRSLKAPPTDRCVWAELEAGRFGISVTHFRRLRRGL